MSDISLDDARDSLFAMQRACERFAAHLSTSLSGLANKKDGTDLWMEEMQEEANRARTFHEGQVLLASQLSSRMEAKIAAVRLEADTNAISELKGEEARTVHPELQKFKLEKQAKILGKYGGVASPLLMAGGPPKGAILKATASAAAVEIHYSKIEDKDARQLAQVMQFKKDKGQEAPSSEGQAQWHKETLDKKGNKEFFKDLQGPDLPQQPKDVAMTSPYGNELMTKLRERQNLEQSAAATPPPPIRQNKEDQNPFGGVTLKHAAAGLTTPVSSGLSHQPEGELAEILRKRQERQGSYAE
jgi:hypothetical protein